MYIARRTQVTNKDVEWCLTPPVVSRDRIICSQLQIQSFAMQRPNPVVTCVVSSTGLLPSHYYSLNLEQGRGFELKREWFQKYF